MRQRHDEIERENVCEKSSSTTVVLQRTCLSLLCTLGDPRPGSPGGHGHGLAVWSALVPSSPGLSWMWLKSIVDIDDIVIRV
jgi:hypothetical protein